MNAPPRFDAAIAVATATAIARRTKAERSTGFEALRAEGITLLQQTSGTVWTDHNLHDPGITMLEALCFALTETAFRSEFPVEDLLAGIDDSIDYTALSLHAPHDAFPCSATTAADHARRLLDRVDGLDDARLVPHRAGQHEGPGRGNERGHERGNGRGNERGSEHGHATPAPHPALPGVMRVWLKLSAAGEDRQQRCEAQALATYRAERGLGEDIDPHVERVQPLPCALCGSIEISGAHEGAELLAEVYHRAARYIDGCARLVGLQALRDQSLPLETIYDGPAVEQGFLPPDAAAQAPQRHLYVSDLLQHLQTTVAGVQSVERLQLVLLEPAPAEPVPADRATQAQAAPSTPAFLPWRSDTHALQLALPGDPACAAAPALTLTRRRQLVAVDAEELRWRVHNLQAADRSRRLREKANLQAEQAADLPRGQYRPASAYRSVQDDFPALYGLGPHGVPESAEPSRKARARQLRAYLMMFDQVIANGRAQTSHLAELFSGAVGRHRTYWWTVLDEAQVPGAQELLLAPRAAIEREVLAPLERASTRRHAVLDHLLALHGEALGQNAMRQYCGHLDAAELERLLLDNKAAYLRDIVPLTRHRARGFDYSRPLWDPHHRDNFSGLARRAALLLGWRHDHARPLMQLPDRNGLQLVAEPQAWRAAAVDAGQAAQAEPVRLRRPQLEVARGHALLAELGVQRGARLPTALLRAGAAHDGYRLLGEAGGAATTLLLRDGPSGAWRALRRYEGSGHRETTSEAACALRDAMLKLNDASEGLHLVEHLLLRPLGATEGTAAAAQWKALHRAGFFTLRLTAVLPNWTVRTHQQGFMRLAAETLNMNCPVHLDLDLQALDPPAMQAFETAYAAWLQARREHARHPAPASAAATAALDAAALAVCQHLHATQA